MSQYQQSWVVYRASIPHRMEPVYAVCKRAEWESMELAKPGQQTLVRDGIAHEAEAERLARGTQGDRKKRISVEDLVEIA